MLYCQFGIIHNLSEVVYRAKTQNSKMKFFVAFACIAVVAADVSHISKEYLPAKTYTQYTPSVAPVYSAPVFAPTYSYPTYSTYSAYNSIPVYSSFKALPTAVSPYAAVRSGPSTFVPRVFAPAPIYSAPTLIGSNYQVPNYQIPNYQIPNYYTQSSVPTVASRSGYYSGFDSVYNGVPALDTGFYSEPLVSVKPETDAVVTEVKESAQPVTLPSPAPSTTEATTSKPISYETTASAATFNNADGYVYKTPNAANQFKF